MIFPDVDPGFGHWLAGFIDGEGHFVILGRRNGGWTCRLEITVRDDDRPIVEEIRRRTGCGSIRQLTSLGSKPGASPAVRWYSNSRAEAVALVGILDRFPLRAKKARDYAIWREAVLKWAARAGTTNGDWSPFVRLHAALTATRAYQGPGHVPVVTESAQLRLAE